MPRTTSPTAIDEELVGRLRYSVARLSRLLRQQDQSGLTPTTTAMLATIARDGPLTLGELATLEQVAPPTITKSVGRLEDAGFVERVPDLDDKRVCRVVLTAGGQRQLDDNRSRRTAWLVERLDLLPADERDRLTQVVELLEHLTTAPEGEAR
ncbi:MAG: putative MarR-family transcriptional regulator [Actinomycetia bacterium]|nr:putative MarR-family transcriptional regulator [Actinomycetes bacterium]